MIGKKFCPRCKSENIAVLDGVEGIPIGYACKDCGYQNNIFPEKEIEEVKAKKKKILKKREEKNEK